ncbi:mycofactocin system GMC family oxidoreductase MftG [Streptomyces sp. SID8361]|uniref:GMC family oxidoreductase n=1 Tax=Streptomyces sp. MnatMP-M27 TaxID=1839768 RepID=UPI00081E2785|nr:GMC family oxidoreductase N-terminal domain-containing protein [Streptomyces sp. MnatMP-M27]MYU11180.1 mycofactocin system GMC family oxidoreductase MftG [Streptomyces sp. SID8361]SCF78949.1 choline dehydrogenase [Streptomyces sp. MnatMP-M27]
MEFDTIVVGAGTAGCVLATRLSEDPGRRVALIEGGADYSQFRNMPDDVKYLGDRPAVLRPGADLSLDWGYVATPAAGRPTVRLPRGKVIGGTGSINGRVFLRAFPSDFAEWVSAGNPDWSFEKVLPWYRAIETDLDFRNEYHGRSGPIRVSRTFRHDWSPEDHAFEEACLAMGYPAGDDLNAPDAEPVGPTPSSSQDGTRWSSARAYLAMARGRSNLTVIPDTSVHRVLFDGGLTVRGILTAAGTVIEAPEVIVSAGALSSPYLLMHSGIGPADHLREVGVQPLADLPGVGRNLRDHPNIILSWTRSGQAPERLRSRALNDSLGLASGLRVRFTAEASDIVDDCMIRSFGSTVMEGTGDGGVGVRMAVALSQETSSGSVRLTSSEPSTLPSVELDFLATADDRSRMRSAVRTGLELAGHKSIRQYVDIPLNPTPDDLADDAAFDSWMRRSVATGHHLTSTCAMGPDPDAGAVVDQYGRVHGTEGLRVADASIMPKCIRPNTQCTTMLIGERIADFVRSQHR